MGKLFSKIVASVWVSVLLVAGQLPAQEQMHIRNTLPAELDTATINMLLDSCMRNRISHPRQTIALTRQLLQRSYALRFYPGIGGAINILSEAHSILGDYRKALYYQEVGITYSTLFQLPYIQSYFNNRANILIYLGAYHDAVDYFLKAIRAIELKNGGGIGGKGGRAYDESDLGIYNNAHIGLFMIWNLLGNTSKARYYIDKALAISLLERDSFNIANAYNLRSSLYMSEPAKPDSALWCNMRALDYMPAGDTTMRINIYSGIIPAYVRFGRKDSAAYFLDELEKLYQNTSLTTQERAHGQGRLGLYNRLLGRWQKAEEYLRRGLDSALVYNLAYLIPQVQEQLNLLYSQTQRYDKALYFHHMMESSQEKLKSGEAAGKITLLENRFVWSKKQKELYMQQLDQAGLKRKLLLQNVILIFSALVLLGGLAFFLVYRKSRKRKQDFLAEQMRAKEKEMESRGLQALVNSAEKERKRIAMELHDGIGSMLAVSRINLNFIRKKYGVQNDENFHEVLKLLDTTAENIRNTSHVLLPDMLLKGGLEEAVRVYCGQIAKLSGVDFQAYGTATRLDPEKEKGIFRIIQQLLEMIKQSAAPESCLLQLNWHDEELYVVAELYDVRQWPSAYPVAGWDDFLQMLAALKGGIETDYSNPADTTLNLAFTYEG